MEKIHQTLSDLDKSVNDIHNYHNYMYLGLISNGKIDGTLKTTFFTVGFLKSQTIGPSLLYTIPTIMLFTIHIDVQLFCNFDPTLHA